MSKMFEYEVSGDGNFPFDMLRYDTAWPAKESEIPRMQRMRGEQELRTILIRSHKKPTVGRWNSFGWIVDRVRII